MPVLDQIIEELPETESVHFTVVIPAYNEENAIREEIAGIHEVLAETGCRYEIVVVDDGSEDATAERAEEADCRLLRSRRNRGYGASLKRGIGQARSEIIVITDADGTYPAAEIPRLLAELGDADMVVGARTGQNVHHSLIRAPAKWFLRMLASYLAGTRIPDLNSGLRVLRRSHVRRYAHLLPSGFSFTTTITLALLCNDYDVKHVPIDYHRRVGSSKIRPVHAYHFLILILRTIVIFNPLKVFIPVGAVWFAIGIVKLTIDLRIGNIEDTSVMGLLGAVLIWSVGLLADQNARMSAARDIDLHGSDL